MQHLSGLQANRKTQETCSMWCKIKREQRYREILQEKLQSHRMRSDDDTRLRDTAECKNHITSTQRTNFPSVGLCFIMLVCKSLWGTPAEHLLHWITFSSFVFLLLSSHSFSLIFHLFFSFSSFFSPSPAYRHSKPILYLSRPSCTHLCYFFWLPHSFSCSVVAWFAGGISPPLEICVIWYAGSEESNYRGSNHSPDVLCMPTRRATH